MDIPILKASSRQPIKILQQDSRGCARPERTLFISGISCALTTAPATNSDWYLRTIFPVTGCGPWSERTAVEAMSSSRSRLAVRPRSGATRSLEPTRCHHSSTRSFAMQKSPGRSVKSSTNCGPRLLAVSTPFRSFRKRSTRLTLSPGTPIMDDTDHAELGGGRRLMRGSVVGLYCGGDRLELCDELVESSA